MATSKAGLPRVVVGTLGKMLRETGQALDRFGLNCIDSTLMREPYARHRQIMPFGIHLPKVATDAWVAPNASVIGDVDVSAQASVWYGAVVKGDNGSITIGNSTNVQDDAVLCDGNVAIGESVTIGHGAIIKASTVGAGCMIGMKSVLDEATIDSGSIVAAGAIVSRGTHVPSGQLWGGNPAVFMRNVTPEETAQLEKTAKEYALLAEEAQAPQKAVADT